MMNTHPHQPSVNPSAFTRDWDRSAPHAPLFNGLDLRRASDRGGNSRRRATVITALPGTTKIKDTVGRGDADFFKVPVGVASRVKLTFKNQSGVDITGAILNKKGRVVRDSGDVLSTVLKPGQTRTLVYDSVTPGTYYLQVTSTETGAHAYQLKLFVKDAPDCGCGDG